MAGQHEEAHDDRHRRRGHRGHLGEDRGPAAGPGEQRGPRDGAQVLREEPGRADPRPVRGAGPAHRLRQHREPGAQGGQSASEGLGDVLEKGERRGVHSYAVHAQVRKLEHVMRGDMG